MLKRTLSTLFKFIVSAVIILYILIYRVSLREIFETLSSVSLFWLILSFSLHSFGLLISAWRWQVLMNAQEIEVPFRFLTQSYLVGAFFNQFLPTRFGGDMVRIYNGSRYTDSLLKSSAIILTERANGILILLLFAFLASIFRLELTEENPVIWISLLIGFSGMAFLLFLLSPFITKLINKIKGKGFLRKIKEKIIFFRDSILIYKKRKKELMEVTFLSILLQINVIVHYYFIGRALKIDIPFLDYFIIMPVVLLLISIPITISGWGVREGALIGIFQFYSYSPDFAVSFSLIDVAFNLIIGIIGGIVYWLRK
ncbi:flippase-like domain-containing protein [Candidatus Aminicenantes bacterium AH-873-B07]|jgi:hypothetical protein|nr:flippase-like domain-containing protein [Candidatus Aminicenantes bacterium AH-873-B07]